MASKNSYNSNSKQMNLFPLEKEPVPPLPKVEEKQKAQEATKEKPQEVTNDEDVAFLRPGTVFRFFCMDEHGRMILEYD